MSEYITDENFNGDLEAVRNHYERLSDVYGNLATLGGHPTIGFAGNAGWYQDEPVTKPALLEDGWEKRTRCTTFERDWEAILDDQLGADDRGREIFNISSWKDADALTERKLSTAPPEREWKDGKATPDYDELRGFGFWFDLDLDNKEGRTALTEEELRSIERVQQRVIEAVADAYGVGTGDIYGLDSGGGAYIYGPPEATLPITEYLDAPERGWVLEDINDKINDGPLTEQVEAIIKDEGAGDLLDPDWIQNKNRQTKAPGAIHHNHDIVVTPLRQRDPATGKVAGEARYRPTRVSELTQADIKELEVWADGLTAIEHTDAVDSFVRSMYPELAQNHDTWKAIIDERAAHLRDVREREQQRREETKKQIAEWVTNEDTPLERPDTDADAAGSLRAPSGLYSGAEIVTEKSEFYAALETIDVRDVVKRHASDAYDTSARAHEITFDPAWRHSGSGKSCAIPSGGNIFIDNGVNAGGGPELAYALGEGIITGGADQSLSGTEFGKAIDAMRADGYQIPVLVPEAGNEYEQTPLWALRKAALALGVVESEDEFKEQETEDGETYLGFDASAYSAVLSALESEGVNHGRSQQTDEKDPRKQAIVRHNDEFESVEDVPDDAIQSTSDTDDTDASPADDTESEPGWESVRKVYMMADKDSDVKKGPARLKAAEQLEAETDWMHIMESERLWWYDGDAGLFKQFGERRIGSILTEKLGQHYSRTEKREITDRLKESNNVHRSDINARHIGEPLLCVGNGVVNLETGEITDHSPEYRFTRGIDVDYPTPENGLESDTSAVLEFIDEITQRTEDRDTLLDHLGHGLMPGHPFRAFVVCFGGGGNGKTQLARLFKGFVGEENTAAVEIDELANGDFATSDLPGKFINWGDDMSGDGGGSLDEISTLKKATGDSDIRCNEKYEKTFDFQNEAAMFFGANEPPRFGETKKSVKDRLYPIRMPYSFESNPDPDNPLEKEKTPRAADRLLEDDAAMRGLLELAVRHARQLRQNKGVYSMPEGPEERFKLYNEQADPIVRFANSMFTEGAESDKIAKQDAHSVYEIMMDIWEERSTSLESFRRQFPKSTTIDIETGQSRTLAETQGERVRVWKRLQWSERAREFMPDWLCQRYADHFESSDAEETDTSEHPVQPEQAPLAGLDPEHGKTITATVTNVSEGEYSREAQGLLKGPHDTVISFVVPGDNSNPMPAYQGDTVLLDGATLRTNDDGLRELIINDAVDIDRLLETDTDDDDADGDTDSDTDETDTQTSETTESPDGPELPQSSSADTPGGEATADGGIEADDDAADTTETDASQSLTAEPDSIKDENESTQAERLQTLKDVLDESTKNREWTTADELEAELGWNRGKIEGYLEKLQRESTLMRTDEGCKYWK